MSHWEISEGYGVPKALKNLRENAPVLRSYARLIEQIKSCGNPAAFGERKSGKYRHCYGAHLTRSVSVVYRVDCASQTVLILDVGDHKSLYGRGNRL